MTTPEPIEELREAVEKYVRAQAETDDRVVTQFVMLAASVSLRTADECTYYTEGVSGPVHSLVGLADMLQRKTAIYSDPTTDD